MAAAGADYEPPLVTWPLPEPDDGAEDELRPELELDLCERDECVAELDLCAAEPEPADPDELPDPDEAVPREADEAWALAVAGST